MRVPIRLIFGLLLVLSTVGLGSPANQRTKPVTQLVEVGPDKPSQFSLYEGGIASVRRYLKNIFAKAINKATFIREASTGLEVVIGSATWCGGCQILKKELRANGTIDHFTVDFLGTKIEVPVRIDEQERGYVEIGTQQFDLRGYPSIIIAYKNEPVSAHMGFTPGFIESLLKLFVESLEKSVAIIDSDARAGMVMGDKRNAAIIAGTDHLNYSSYKILRNIQEKFSIWNNGSLKQFSLYGAYEPLASVEVDFDVDWLSYRTAYMNPYDPYKEGTLSWNSLRDAAKSTTEAKNRLWVVVGHGSRGHLPTTGFNIDPEEMRNTIQRPGRAENAEGIETRRDIVVSGACFSGVFYDAPTCGFFAANPESYSSGCFSSSDADVSPYYLSLFFKAVTDREADINKNGQVSFIEAHNYATKNKVAEDNPFSSLDGYALAAFESGQIVHNESVNWDEFESLLQAYGTTDDLFLYNGLRSNAVMRWATNFKGVESSGYDEKMLLFRRVMFRKYASEHPTSPAAGVLARVDSCQNQSVKSFLYR